LFGEDKNIVNGCYFKSQLRQLVALLENAGAVEYWTKVRPAALCACRGHKPGRQRKGATRTTKSALPRHPR
jgi:hypothetical protein